MKPIAIVASCLLALVCTTPGWSANRIKDLTDVEHDRTNAITGLGLVMGLDGTGGQIPTTREVFVSLIQRFGRPVDPLVRARLRNDNRLTTDSMSLVVVTAKLETWDQVGSEIDVTVASMDGATDLNWGLLVATPLLGMDKEVYAIASGRVTTGGILAQGAAATVQKNHSTTGMTRATVEKRVPKCSTDEGFFRLLLRDPDYETAARIQQAINRKFTDACTIVDPGIVRINIPPRFYEDRIRFTSMVQQERVVPDIRARVAINSQTGTVVVSENVTLARAAVTHGNISVITGETPLVSQPLPRSRGETVVVPRTEIDVVEDRNPLTVLDATSNVMELAEALNALGVSPQDLTSIFQQLHAAGVLHADLVIK